MTDVTVTQHHGGEKATVSPIAAVKNSQGTLKTATTAQGSLVTRPLEPTDRVRIGPGEGMEVTLEQAVQYGHLTKNQDGSYSDASGSSQESRTDSKATSETSDTNDEQNDSPEDSQAALEVSQGSLETLQDWANSARELTGGNTALVGMVGEVIERGPDQLPALMKSMCEHYGVEPEKAQATMLETFNDVQQGISEYVTAFGAEPEAFFNTVYANDRSAFRGAVIAAVFEENTAPLFELVSKFKRSGQGKATEDEGQTVKVQINGHTVEMDKATARARGLL